MYEADVIVHRTNTPIVTECLNMDALMTRLETVVSSSVGLGLETVTSSLNGLEQWLSTLSDDMDHRFHDMNRRQAQTEDMMSAWVQCSTEQIQYNSD